MKLRHLLTASFFGMVLAVSGPAMATSGDRATDPAASATGQTDNVHKADWRDRRAGRRAYRGERRRAYRGDRRGYRAERRARRHYRAERRARRHYRAERRAYRHDRRVERRHYRRDDRIYRRGGYLPHRHYRVVDNWRDYGWRRPYRGERYVYADGRYLLIQIATGLIITALLY